MSKDILPHALTVPAIKKSPESALCSLPTALEDAKLSALSFVSTRSESEATLNSALAGPYLRLLQLLLGS